MLRGLYTAYTGMNAQQFKMDSISNNLANVNTTGFKEDGVYFKSFKDLFVEKINDPETTGGERIGSMSFGVGVGETYVNHAQGAINLTGLSNQAAILGDGFFTIGVKQADGTFTEKFSRDGSFNLGPNGELMTIDGDYVLGENGPITVNSTESIVIHETGAIYEDGQLLDKLKMIAFEDPNELNKLGGSLYELSTEAVEKPFDGTIKQGYLEASNVNSVEEMVNMINVMRSYEACQKVMTTYDSTLDKAVNQIGTI